MIVLGVIGWAIWAHHPVVAVLLTAHFLFDVLASVISWLARTR